MYESQANKRYHCSGGSQNQVSVLQRPGSLQHTHLGGCSFITNRLCVRIVQMSVTRADGTGRVSSEARGTPPQLDPSFARTRLPPAPGRQPPPKPQTWWGRGKVKQGAPGI